MMAGRNLGGTFQGSAAETAPVAGVRGGLKPEVGAGTPAPPPPPHPIPPPALSVLAGVALICSAASVLIKKVPTAAAEIIYANFRAAVISAAA